MHGLDAPQINESAKATDAGDKFQAEFQGVKSLVSQDNTRYDSTASALPNENELLTQIKKVEVEVKDKDPNEGDKKGTDEVPAQKIVESLKKAEKGEFDDNAVKLLKHLTSKLGFAKGLNSFLESYDMHLKGSGSKFRPILIPIEANEGITAFMVMLVKPGEDVDEILTDYAKNGAKSKYYKRLFIAATNEPLETEKPKNPGRDI